MKSKNKLKGYTLIELLVATGVLSLAAIGLYSVSNIASDWRKISQEVMSLNMAIKEIDNSTNTVGSYSGITLENLPASKFISTLGLLSVNSLSETSLSFEYENISSRICTDFISKMMSSSKNIMGIVNGKEITENNLQDISLACDGNYGDNEITIVINKEQAQYTIDNVVASINPPNMPQPDIVIPVIPSSQPGIVIPDFIPGAGNPITYPLITGSPPVFPPSIGGGGVIGVIPPSNIGSPVITPPSWTPPVVIKPPSTPAAPDIIDQDPDPPPVRTTETRVGSCPSGYLGSTLESRTKTYYPGTGRTTYSSWVETSRSCYLPPPPPPPPPPAGPPPLTPSTPWSSYFYGTFLVHIPNSLELYIRITPAGMVSGGGINEWCQSVNGVVLPSGHKCPAGYTYVGANITLDGSSYYNGVFNTTWRTNIASDGTAATSNPLQATGAANGSYISGAFLTSLNDRVPFTAYRISSSY